MVMSWIWAIFLAVSLLFAAMEGRGSFLAASTVKGAQEGVSLAISIGGSICLWSGVGALMDRAGLTQLLSGFMMPALKKIFPSVQKDKHLAKHLSTNICANFLGLGNAATPMGIQAAKRLVDPNNPSLATDELCRLIVLNTASIQLIPANVAAIRASLGCNAPFDILPAVWITSLCSAGLGLVAAWGMGKLCRHG